MPTPIEIDVDGTKLAAELNDSATAQAIAGVLPLSATASRWGDEYYFGTSIEQPLADDAREEFAVGELGFWPAGNAFCLFFGPTPASTNDTPVMASPGNPIGQVTDDATVLRSRRGSVRISVKPAT